MNRNGMGVRSVCFVLLLAVALAGCASMSQWEKSEYKNLEFKLKSAGYEPIKEKDPAMAGILNVLPGIGNLYLEQYGVFVANLLFWPFSVVWGVPQAVIDANTINKKATLSYYLYGPGKERLQD